MITRVKSRYADLKRKVSGTHKEWLLSRTRIVKENDYEE